MQENIANNQIVITENMLREEIRNVIHAKLVGHQMTSGANFEAAVQTALQPLVMEAVRQQMKSIFTTLGYSSMF